MAQRIREPVHELSQLLVRFSVRHLVIRVLAALEVEHGVVHRLRQRVVEIVLGKACLPEDNFSHVIDFGRRAAPVWPS